MKLLYVCLCLSLFRLSDAGITVTPNENKPRLLQVKAEHQRQSQSMREDGCGQYISMEAGETIEIESPNYPGYDANVDCYTTITVAANTGISLYCSEFDLAAGDYLYVALNGDIANEIALTGNSLLNDQLQVQPMDEEFDLWVDFVSDDGDEGDGYKCEITSAAGGSGSPSTSPPSPTPVPSGDCPCGVANEASRIVNGEETTENEYPWQVGLVSPGGRTPWCGGTIINSKYVMTAAHCTEDGSEFQIVVGEHDHTDASTGQVVNVKRVINHPNYVSNTLDNDFALVELDSELTFSTSIRPACLPKDASNMYAGVDAVVSGWGTLQSGGSQPDKLNEVTVKTLANNNCGNYATSQITENMLCASAPNKDSCQGDSGGPLVTKESNGRYSLIGVVSWGRGCAEDGYPGVYARITKVLPWIQSNTAGSETCNV